MMCTSNLLCSAQLSAANLKRPPLLSRKLLDTRID